MTNPNLRLLSFSIPRLTAALLALWSAGAVLAGPETNGALLGRAPQTPLPAQRAVVGAVKGTPQPSHYWLTVLVEPARHRMTGMAKIAVVGAESAQALTFQLNGQLTVSSVREGGTSVAFSRGKSNQESKPLVVQLAPGSQRQGPREITIEYQGSVAPPGATDPDWMGVLLLRTNEIRMTEQTKWYPVLSGPSAPVEALITLPSELRLVWPGELTKRSDDGKATTWQASATPPIMPALIAGTYTDRTLAWGQRTLSARLFPESAAAAEPLLEESRRILGFLESQFGPYPFTQFAVCQMRVLDGRYSYNFSCPGAVVLPTEIVQRAARPEQKAFWTRKLAHEIAHQWWGCSIALSDDSWPLHESLAELAAVLYLQSLEPTKPWSEFLTAEAEEARLASFLARRGQALSARELRKGLGYEKGPCVLAMLRDTLGPEAFDQALRAFYAQHAFGRVSRAEFQQCFGSCPTLPLSTFFSQWIDRPVLPRLQVEPVPGEGPEGRLTLRLSQPEPAFVLPVEVRLTTATNSYLTRCVLANTQQLHQVQLDGRLLSLEVDPARKLLLEGESGAATLARALAGVKAGYAGLNAAFEAQDWPTVDAHARTLRDTFRQLFLALDWEQLREGLRARDRLDARTEFRLAQEAELKPAIEAVLLKPGQEATVRRVMRELAEAADQIHHALREQKPENVAAQMPKLKAAWEEFSRQALVKAPGSGGQ